MPEIHGCLDVDQLHFSQISCKHLKQCNDYGKEFYVVATRQLVREMVQQT